MNDRSPLLPDGETPADARARIALRAALALLVPLARWLVRNGVGYASFAPALKTVFVEAARRELGGSDAKPTDSALSVLSGVHRRDIREMGQAASPSDAQPKAPSVASQLFTRWLTDAALRGADDRPRPIPKSASGDTLSFDALARQVSSDVHPRTLLDEMQRLGLVAVEGDQVHLQAEAFVPQEGFEEMAGLLSDNVSDHLAAAVHNLQGVAPKFLEQSLFGSGLSPASAEALGDSARRLWQEAFRQMAAEAAAHLKRDAADHATSMRMRFGVYFYAEPKSASAPAAPRPARTRGQTLSHDGSSR